jgi:hypothetical protein
MHVPAEGETVLALILRPKRMHERTAPRLRRNRIREALLQQQQYEAECAQGMMRSTLMHLILPLLPAMNLALGRLRKISLVRVIQQLL